MRRSFLKYTSIMALVFGLTLGGTQLKAQAQADPSESSNHRGHREQMSPDQQLERSTKALNLSDDQKSQLRPILQDRQEKMQSIHSDTSLSRQDRMAKMHSVFEESNDKIRGVLNDDRKQKFEQMQQRRRERMQSHGTPEKN